MAKNKKVLFDVYEQKNNQSWIVLAKDKKEVAEILEKGFI